MFMALIIRMVVLCFYFHFPYSISFWSEANFLFPNNRSSIPPTRIVFCIRVKLPSLLKRMNKYSRLERGVANLQLLKYRRVGRVRATSLGRGMRSRPSRRRPDIDRYASWASRRLTVCRSLSSPLQRIAPTP